MTHTEFTGTPDALHHAVEDGDAEMLTKSSAHLLIQLFILLRGHFPDYDGSFNMQPFMLVDAGSAVGLLNVPMPPTTEMRDVLQLVHMGITVHPDGIAQMVDLEWRSVVGFGMVGEFWAAVVNPNSAKFWEGKLDRHPSKQSCRIGMAMLLDSPTLLSLVSEEHNPNDWALSYGDISDLPDDLNSELVDQIGQIVMGIRELKEAGQ